MVSLLDLTISERRSGEPEVPPKVTWSATTCPSTYVPDPELPPKVTLSLKALAVEQLTPVSLPVVTH
jgi:hypothetical protein